MFDKQVWIQFMLIMGVIEDKSLGINQHWSRKWFGTQQVPRHYGRQTHICVSKLGRNWFRQWLVTCAVDCDDLIAICRVSPGGLLWVFMTSPSSMLVPDHCVCKGQHSTFDDSWTWSYLRGAREKFAGNVTNSIILVICVHTWLFCNSKL